MNLISGGRGTGKTRNLILAAHANGGTVVCKNPDAMRTKMLGYGVVVPCISYSDALGQAAEGGWAKLYVDELEEFLATMGIVAATFVTRD